VNSDAREGKAVPASYKTPAVTHMQSSPVKIVLVREERQYLRKK